MDRAAAARQAVCGPAAEALPVGRMLLAVEVPLMAGGVEDFTADRGAEVPRLPALVN